jgi:hypothetical protein
VVARGSALGQRWCRWAGSGAEAARSQGRGGAATKDVDGAEPTAGQPHGVVQRCLGSGRGASVRVTAWRPAWTRAAGIGVEASGAGRQWRRAAAASGSDPKRGGGKNCSR